VPFVLGEIAPFVRFHAAKVSGYNQRPRVSRWNAKGIAKDSRLPEAGIHESFEPHHDVRAASPRAFGLMLAAVSLLVGLWPLLSEQSPRWWALVPALLAGVLGWRTPQIFAGPNRAWMKVGALLARIVAPIALALLYFAMFVPMGWWMRVTGRDPLRLRREPGAASYWIEREPPGPSGESLNHPY